MTIPIKKAKLVIVAEGCIDCGTHDSFSWTPAKTVTIEIDRRTYSFVINRCGDCQKKINDSVQHN